MRACGCNCCPACLGAGETVKALAWDLLRQVAEDGKVKGGATRPIFETIVRSMDAALNTATQAAAIALAEDAKRADRAEDLIR